MSVSRRNFLKVSAMGGAAFASIPTIVSSCTNIEASAKNVLGENDVVLFQGDSITDAGRNKDRELPNDARSFGNGYAYIAAADLLNAMPEMKLAIYNRGISGNKVYQLAERWEKDCIGLNPSVLSILIGVNDYWHKRNGNYDGTPQIYESDFRKLLNRTKEHIPDIRLVICQPFILQNTSAVDDTWLAPFKEYQEIAEKISDEFNAIWVPYQELFNEAVKHAPENYWLADGVHPTMAGAQLMAEAWLKFAT